jgi:peptidoglycan/xylan/chitin deacetylase (PgdA/CDA1 family)
MGTMLIGCNVEWLGEGNVTLRFLEQARSLHNRLGVLATLFIVGQTLERWIAQFRAMASDSFFDLQQHTYSHQLLKTVYIEDGRSVRVVRGVTIEQTREEVHKTTSLLQQHLGVECIGLTGPWCYYRGLRDRPGILQVLWEEGIRFKRKAATNESGIRCVGSPALLLRRAWLPRDDRNPHPWLARLRDPRRGHRMGERGWVRGIGEAVHRAFWGRWQSFLAVSARLVEHSR